MIAFDIIFDETKSAEDDQLFSEAIRKANNVVLCEYIRREKIPLSDKGGSHVGSLNIEKLVTPIPPLSKAAVALAPFPLPKIPIRVNQLDIQNRSRRYSHSASCCVSGLCDGGIR